MPTYTYTGAASGVLNASGNWSPTLTTPANDDVYVFDGGTNAPSSNLTAFGSLTGITAIVGRNNNIDLGSSSQSITFGSGLILNYQGNRTAKAYIEPSAAGVANISGGRGGGVEGLVLKGTWSELRTVAGFTTLAGTCPLIYTEGQNVYLTIAAAATPGTAYTMGGRVDCESAITTVEMKGGTWYQTGSSSADVTNLETHSHDSTFVWSAPGGDIATKLLIWAGTFDATRNAAPKTISCSSGNAQVHGMGRIDLRNHANNITVSNAIEVFGSGEYYSATAGDFSVEIPKLG